KRHIKKGYRALDVRLPEQFSLIGKLRAQYPVVTLCHVFGVHRSSYKYWEKSPEKPDGTLLQKSEKRVGASDGLYKL
ncbi:IS3 family transposase, partial [Salmonella enterica]